MTLIEESTVLLKLKEYKRKLDERENEVFSLVGFCEGEIDRLNVELEKAESRHLLEYSEETKEEVDNLKTQIKNVQDELQQHLKFIANLQRRRALYLELTEEEEESLLDEIDEIYGPLRDKTTNLIAAANAYITAWREYSNEYANGISELDAPLSLISEVCGASYAKKIIRTVDRTCISEASNKITEVRTTIMDPNGMYATNF